MSDILSPTPPADHGNDTDPVTLIPTPLGTATAQFGPPAILRAKTPDGIAQAQSLGFNFVLLPGVEMLSAAQASGLGLLLELDLNQPDADSPRTASRLVRAWRRWPRLPLPLGQ